MNAIFVNNKARRKRSTGRGLPLEPFIKKHSRPIRRAWSEFWKNEEKKITLKAVRHALVFGDLPQKTKDEIDTDIQDFIKSEIEPLLILAASDAGRHVTGKINGILRSLKAFLPLIFDPETKATIDFIEKNGADLVVQVKASYKAAIRAVLKFTQQQGLSQAKTVLMLKKGMKLTQFESLIAENVYKKIFKEALAKRVLAGTPRPQIGAEVDALNAYLRKVEQLKIVRANRIARTELARAKHHGEIQAHLQAVNKGRIAGALKRWVKYNSKDNWESTNLYNGVEIPVDKDFGPPYPSKTTMLDFSAPGEINERCGLEYFVIPN